MKKSIATFYALFVCLGFPVQTMATEIGVNWKQLVIPMPSENNHTYNEISSQLASIKPKRKASISKNVSSRAIDKIETGSLINGVFGSKLVSFSGLDTQKDWNRVKRQVEYFDRIRCKTKHCKKRRKKIVQLIKRGQSMKFYNKLKLVHSSINTLITYKSDKENYNISDYWAMPMETIIRGRGDCEDFATLKLAMLKKLGIPSKSMSLVVLKDTNRNLYHAVLAVSTNKGSFILDNAQSQVLKDRQLPQYLPLYSFNENRSWIHGRGANSGKQITAIKNFGIIQPGKSTYDPNLKLTSLSEIDIADLRPTY